LRVMSFALLILNLPGSAFGTDRVVLPVSQPLEDSGNTAVIAQVLYVDFFNTWQDPATPVVLTAAENHLTTKSGVENLNLANLLGITVVPLPGSPDIEHRGETFLGLYGDTLAVYVRVPPDSEMEFIENMGRRYARYVPEVTVPATITCLKENARRLWPRVRYLKVMMQGNAAYLHQGGVFSLVNVVASPWPHDWRR